MSIHWSSLSWSSTYGYTDGSMFKPWFFMVKLMYEHFSYINHISRASLYLSPHISPVSLLLMKIMNNYMKKKSNNNNNDNESEMAK